MKRANLFLGVSIAATAMLLSIVTIQQAKHNLFNASFGDPSDYSLLLDESATPAELTSSYQNTVKGDVETDNGNAVKLGFANAKTADGLFVKLANHGKIYNFGASQGQLTSLTAIEYTGDYPLSFRAGVSSYADGALLADKSSAVSIPNDGTKTTVQTCDFFELEAGDSGAEVTELVLYYSCDAAAYDVKTINGVYTGVGQDGYTYKLTVNNGAVDIESLDMLSNIHLSGTVALSSRTAARCTFVYNTYNIFYDMAYDGFSFSFVGKSDEVGGGAAAAVTQISTLDRVYNVEDFQSYSATGTGYVSAEAKYTTTGLRSQFYADYYTGSSTGEIGGSGWPIMTSTDNTTLLSTKGHNGSKAVALKFSNGMGMRYISMNELYGVKSIIGKGATLSFWVRGAYTNTNFNANHASDTPMKAYAFYDSPLTPSNQTTVRESFDFTVTAGDEWQHFEMPLTVGKKYYGFGFYAKQSSGSTQYVPIDDIQIYTASPYAEYVAPVAATGVALNNSELNLTTGQNSQLVATVSPNDATNKNVTWVSNNTSVATVDNEGNVHAVSAGNATITVTTDDGGFTATCDVTVTNPATYYPEGTYKATVSVMGNSADVVLAFGNSTNGLIGVRISNTDMIPGSVTYNDATNEFSIPTSGLAFESYSAGTISGTYDYANDRLINVNCSGTLGQAVSNLTLTKPTANYYECDGNTSALQSQFKRRYMSGSWQVDNSNADRITSNTTEFVSGTGAVKRRGYSGGAVALNFNSDFSPAVTVKNVQFWVYNPSGSNITLRMWGYKAASFGSNFETGSVTAIAGQWTYVAMGFNSAAIYNFQIADFNNTGVYLTFDNIYLF